MSGGVIWTDDVNGPHIVFLYRAEFLALGKSLVNP